ncbi:hypothetical protein M9458_024622, partial [Cirrhinus mrigala]
PEAYKCQPFHPLLPPPPLPSVCAVGSPRFCQSPSALWLEDPLSSPPASESRTPPLPVDPAAPPWVLAPSFPPWPGSPLDPPGSLVPPALPWSGLQSSGFASSLGSTLVLCCFGSTAAFWIRASTSVASAIGSTSVLQAPPPPAPLLPFSSMAPLSVNSNVGRHHGCGLGPAWVPPGSSCSKSLLSSPWLLSPSSPPWTLLLPSSHLCLPLLLSTARGRAFLEGGN